MEQLLTYEINVFRKLSIELRNYFV